MELLSNTRWQQRERERERERERAALIRRKSLSEKRGREWQLAELAILRTLAMEKTLFLSLSLSSFAGAASANGEKIEKRPGLLLLLLLLGKKERERKLIC